MMLKYLSNDKLQQIEKTLPDIDFLAISSKIVNFITMNLSTKSQQWRHVPHHLHIDHMFSQAFIQLHFKNHIMDMKGLMNLEEIIKCFQNTENDDILMNFIGSPKDIVKNRKSLYIMDDSRNMQSQALMQMAIMNQKKINKILCYEKTSPIFINDEFEKFCRNNSIRALGLNNLTTKSLIKQVMKHSKLPILIHEIPMQKQQIYTKIENEMASEQKKIQLKYTVNDILVLCNWVNKLKIKEKNMLEVQELLKNYAIRTFPSKSETPNYSIKRFQRLDDIAKASQIIAREEGQYPDDQ